MNVEDGKWWDVSLNPIRLKGGGFHCTKTSPGCLNCWAETLNLRFYNDIPYDNRPVEYVIDRKILEQPIHWKKPRRIFMCDMMDIFHQDVSDEQIFTLFETMNYSRHTFLILTKRPDRNVPIVNFTDNIWLGVSVEDQKTADERIPLLLQFPAAHNFINIEPLLEKTEVIKFLVKSVPPYTENAGEVASWYKCEVRQLKKQIDWVIIGCESLGNRAGRPCKLQWVRPIIADCEMADIPLWIKQLNINGKVSKNMLEWQEDLRIRQWPK